MWIDSLWVVIDHEKDDEVVATFLTEKGARHRALVLGYRDGDPKTPRFEVFQMMED